MFFDKLYRRVEDLERNKDSFVACRSCRAAIKRENARKVVCYFKDLYREDYNYYCGICDPEYDTLEEQEDGTIKYTKRVVEIVEVFPEEKSK